MNNQNIKIHIGMGTCALAAGAQEVYEQLLKTLDEYNIQAEVIKTGCVGMCSEEVIVDIEKIDLPKISYGFITPDNIKALITQVLIENNYDNEWLLGKYETFKDYDNEQVKNLKNIAEVNFNKKQRKLVLKNCGHIDPESIDDYLKAEGFNGLKKALSIKPVEVINTIKESGLKGRGGAGFPTGLKWELAHNQNSDEKYMICNADEGDPGAFMDRSIIESDPFALIEGLTIAAYAIGANKGYIYIRAEYPLAIERLQKALIIAKEKNFTGDNIQNSGFNFEIKIKKGAGAFVCGEETSLIASIEGKRGTPKPRPPFPVQKGLFDEPSCINNVETLANVPLILRKGSEWYSNIGTTGSKGTKIFALTGKVKKPGLVEVPMGVTLREIVYDIGGGVLDDKKLKAVQIGGPSGGCIPEHLLDIPIDYDSLRQAGAMMGSGGLVVMDESSCMVDVAKFFLGFMASESCGKCTPCREGTTRMLEIFERITTKKELLSKEEAELREYGFKHLENLAQVIKDTSLCGLGQTAPNPVISTLKYFEDEYKAHVEQERCPSGACKSLTGGKDE